MRLVVVILALFAQRTNAGYDRGEWLKSWGMVSKCVDAREAVLKRQAVDIKTNKSGCMILSGTIVDGYSGDTIDIKDADIDHVIPLKYADSVTRNWPDSLKRAFGSDTMNLVATGKTANRSKGSRPFPAWVPKDSCGYAVRWLDVKSKYGMSVGIDELSFAWKSCRGSISHR